MENAIKLGDFLAEGNIIRTKHCDNTSWVTNVVYEIKEDSIEIDIGIEKDYISSIIMVGDAMKCKYTSGDYEYTIIGWVSRIKADFPQSLTIRVHDVEKFGNKRSNYRYDIYLCSVVKAGSKDNKGVFAVMTNISKTGAAFIIHEEIEKLFNLQEMHTEDLRTFFDIFISPEKKLSFEGRIKRKIPQEKGVEYGICIVDITAQNDRILTDFLNELENKDKEFYNKQSSFWSKNSKFDE